MKAASGNGLKNDAEKKRRGGCLPGMAKRDRFGGEEKPRKQKTMIYEA